VSKVSFRGVFVGAITDIVATDLLNIPLVMYEISKHDTSNLPKEQAHATLVAAWHGDTLVYLAGLFIGLACSVFGGYVAAYIAEHDELLNGLLSSFLCVTMGVYSIAAGHYPSSRWIEAAMLSAAAPICGLAGGYLRFRQRQPSAQQF
jgi:hypothetical protein